MTWVTGTIVYVLIWWVVLFMALPWGAAPAAKPEEGHAESAPARPMLGRKALATTVVSAVIWLAIYFVIEAGIIQFSGSIPLD